MDIENAATEVQKVSKTVAFKALSHTHGNAAVYSFVASFKWERQCVGKKAKQTLLAL